MDKNLKVSVLIAIKLIVISFAIELFIMYILSNFINANAYTKALIDSLILSIVLIPFIYIFVIIPIKKLNSKISHQKEIIKNIAKKRYREIIYTQDIAINLLNSVIEFRDIYTGKHSIRTKIYIECLLKKLKKNTKYKNLLTEKYINYIKNSAALHDIGKIGVPDNILLLERKLTENEYDIIKHHAEYGATIIEKAKKDYAAGIFLDTAMEIAKYHHERWDGSGYPDGLKSQEIPFSARIMAIVDVYDAMTDKRRYRNNRISHNETIEFIREKSGIHFDPDIVMDFLKIENKIKKLMIRFSDK